MTETTETTEMTTANHADSRNTESIKEICAAVISQLKEDDEIISKLKESEEKTKSERVYSNSTHSYLLYFREDGYKHWSGFSLGIFAIILQFILYGVCISEANYFVKNNEVSVMVKYDDCACLENSTRCENSTTVSLNGTLEDYLTCEANELGADLAALNFACIIVVGLFLQHDMLSVMKIWFFDRSLWKMTFSLLIFACNLVALFTGCCFAFQGYIEGSAFAIIVNCVGVLFIHEIDDRVFAALQVINSKEFESLGVCVWCGKLFNCYCTCCWIVVVLLVGWSATLLELGSEVSDEVTEDIN